MYALKGFITHADFADNTVATVAKIGEISTHALTYSREKGQYTHASAPGLTLISFLSAKDGKLQRVPTTMSEHVLGIAKFIYQQTLGNAQQVFADELLNLLISTYAGRAEGFECGAIAADGRYYMPEWVSWRNTVPGEGPNEIRIWFTDESFRVEYDEKEIVVVPPIDNLDDFFKTPKEVETLLKAVTESDRFQRMQNAKQGYPESILRSESYDYNNPLVASHKLPTNWGVLIYSEAGNNIDSISDRLVEYILANSTHTREEWTKLFPDIFKRTEVILMPLWGSIAIPAKETQRGLYSQNVSVLQAMELFKKTVSGYPATQIEAYASILGHQYNGLALMAVGGPDNRDGKYRLSDIIPDYLPVSTTSQDFNRMSMDSRGWCVLLQQLITLAEVMTEHSSIPAQAGYTRTIRDGVLYIVKNYQNINYLVAAKKNFTAK